MDRGGFLREWKFIWGEEIRIWAKEGMFMNYGVIGDVGKFEYSFWQT
jgi:hypothetical protein